MQQAKPPGDQITLQGSFNGFYLICRIHSRCVMPFLRTGMGSRAQGLYAVVAGVFMFYLAHALYDQPLLNFFWVWLVAVVVQRMLSGRAAKSGLLIHSQFDGYPTLALRLCPFIRDESMARLAVEPMICFAAGYLLLSWSDALGKLVMSAALSLMFLENFDRHVTNKREQQILDARLEAEHLSQGVRRRMGY